MVSKGANECVRAEMAVYDPDGQLVGRVDGVPGSRMQVAGRYMVPLSMVARIEGGRAYLAAAARQYLATPVLEPGEPWPAQQWRTGDRSPGLGAATSVAIVISSAPRPRIAAPPRVVAGRPGPGPRPWAPPGPAPGPPPCRSPDRRPWRRPCPPRRSRW